MTASDGNGEWNLDALGKSGHRYTKCGRRKHGTNICDTDLTKIKYFKTQKFGYILANCPDKSGKDKGDGKGVIKGKGKNVWIADMKDEYRRYCNNLYLDRFSY